MSLTSYSGIARQLVSLIVLLLLATHVQAETTSWNAAPNTNLLTGNDVRASTPAGVTVTTSGTVTPTISGNTLAIQSGTTIDGVTGLIFMQMTAAGTQGTSGQTVTFNFTEDVYNLQFTIADIDGGPTYSSGGNIWNDWVYVNSNSGVPSSVVPNNATQVTWNAAQGRLEAIGNVNNTTAVANAVVTFAGPVRTVTIRHVSGPTAGTSTNQFIGIDDLTYLRSPQLRVQKSHSPAQAAAVAYTFNLTNSVTTSTNVTVPAAGTATNGSFVTLASTNTATTVTETAPAGWVFNGATASCSDSNSAVSGNPATFTAPIASTQRSFTVAATNIRPAAVITCAVANVRAPQLTLVKTVTNDNGGSQVEGNWNLTATGPTTLSGATGSAAVTSVTVPAGTYALGETGPAGYTASAWSCTAGTLSGSNLTLAANNNATCTINNNDTQPRLTLVKTVTNDNGGTAAVTAWTLAAAGPTNISGTSGSAAVTNAAVNAGTYTLSESGGPAGYTMGSWSCTAGTLTGSSLVLTPGQNATCTINNNDTQPRLTLVKTVTNDNGGTQAVSAWTLTATGPTNISGASGTAAVTNAAVNAGSYTLGETGPAGYAMGAWSCTAGTLTGSSLVLSVGQTATCTINNNDIGPVLTLVKTITGDGAPSNVPSFTLTATGPVTISGVTGNAAVTNATVSAGTYALSETGPAGYSAGAWSCTAGTLTGSSLVLAVGQTATCTINNVKLPTVTLRKISNGGVGGFQFSGGNGIPNQTITTTSSGTGVNGALTTLTAASTATAITETQPAAFWQIQSASCTGMGSGGTATLSGTTLTLNAAATAAGSNIVCTFTNERRPTVSVQKTTTGGFGGTFTFADTNLTGAFSGISTTAANSPTPAAPVPLIATATGTAVTITETSPLSFVPAGVVCTDANSAVSGNSNPVASSATGNASIPAAAIRIGADINCVFTNALATPQLSVVKTTGSTSVTAAGQVISYTIAVSNTGNATLTAIAVADPLGTTVCPSTSSSTITSLAPGASENCTLSYTVPQSVLDNNGGGDGDIDNTATASTTYNSAPVSANGSTAVAITLNPRLTVVKLASTPGPVSLNQVITYSFRVTNSGNVTLADVTVDDTHFGYGTPPVPGNEAVFNDVSPLLDSSDGGTDASWDSLAPGDTVVFTGTYTVVQPDIDNLQ